MKSSLVQERGRGELRGPENVFQDDPNTGQWNVQDVNGEIRRDKIL